ncbi:hypothetical protein ACU8KH_02573 [Lachancea thermotolerans]
MCALFKWEGHSAQLFSERCGVLTGRQKKQLDSIDLLGDYLQKFI